MPERHFPPPWSVEQLDSCFVVKDLNGQALAYVYFEKEPRRRFRRELRLGERPLTETATTFLYASGLRSSSGSLAKMAAMRCP